MDIVFDEQLVARRRERAISNGNSKADFLLNIVAQEMADRLSVVERRFPHAVELHGATGVVASKVQATGKVDHMSRIETDARFAISPEHVETAAIGDVPTAAASVNLVLSPLALHIVNDIPGMLIRIRQALKPDGLLLAAIPGAGTLSELRETLLATEAEMTGGASARVIPFADVRDIGSLLQRAGFALPVVDVETYTVRYDSLFPLMHDLRAMGMSNPLVERSRRPLSRDFFLKAAQTYAERFSDPDGRIRATFSVIYASGWAPHESQQQPLKPGSAKVRLADALRKAGSDPGEG